MGIFTGRTIKEAGEGVKSAFDGIKGLVDNITTTKEEKLTLKNKLVELENEMQRFIDEQVTARHKSDMSSDSWLSKNIRPLTLIFILFLYSLFSVLDGNIGDFDISQNYIELLGQWGMLIMSFYFGSRGAEKITRVINEMRKERKE